MLTINFVSTVTRTDHGSVLLDTVYLGKASLYHQHLYSCLCAEDFANLF
uniref:Uncharacterized protein n=1 Tax=Anguilla anguilla TaxID=7936 RepID=A0A0E9Q362_ANGAN